MSHLLIFIVWFTSPKLGRWNLHQLFIWSRRENNQSCLWTDEGQIFCFILRRAFMSFAQMRVWKVVLCFIFFGCSHLKGITQEKTLHQPQVKYMKLWDLKWEELLLIYKMTFNMWVLMAIINLQKLLIPHKCHLLQFMQ